MEKSKRLHPGAFRLDRGCRRPRRGIALILTLLVLSILIVIVLQMSLATKTELKVSENYLSDTQNYYAMKAGIAYASVILKSDAADTDHPYDYLAEEWAQPTDLDEENGAHLHFQIEDEDHKFNANRLVGSGGQQNPAVRDQFLRLFKVLGPDNEKKVEALTDYLDWGDTDTGRYEEGAKNTYMYTLEELLQVGQSPGGEGVLSPGVVYGDTQNIPLMPLVTLWTNPVGLTGQVNINTAPKEIFMALSDDITEEIARNIVEYRTSGQGGAYKPFEKIEDIQKVPGFPQDPAVFSRLSPSLSVKSNTFTVHLLATTGSVTSKAKAILQRSQNDIRLLFYDDDQGLTGLLPQLIEKQQPPK